MEKLELKDKKQKGLVERYYWNPLSRVNYKQLLEILFESISACMLSHFSHVQLFATLLTVACQVPLSMGFSRQEYWNGLPCLPPGDVPDPGVKPASLVSPALAGRFFTTSATLKFVAGKSVLHFLSPASGSLLAIFSFSIHLFFSTKRYCILEDIRWL